MLKGFTDSSCEHYALLVAASVVITVGCSNEADRGPALTLQHRASFDEGAEVTHHPREAGTGEAGAGQGLTREAGTDGTKAGCSDPTLGVPGNFAFVGPTAAFVDLCQSGGCSGLGGAFGNTSQVALDYGSFPFRSSNGRPIGTYFYFVVAPGQEDALADGAPGNLSEDTRADRTIVITADQVPAFFPTSHGTHTVSFPPSQFMAISLAPFDTTPDGNYVLAICPANATSRCDCAYEAFHVVPAEAPDGSSGGAAAVDAGPSIDAGAVIPPVDSGSGVEDAGARRADAGADASCSSR